MLTNFEDVFDKKLSPIVVRNTFFSSPQNTQSDWICLILLLQVRILRGPRKKQNLQQTLHPPLSTLKTCSDDSQPRAIGTRTQEEPGPALSLAPQHATLKTSAGTERTRTGRFSTSHRHRRPVRRLPKRRRHWSLRQLHHERACFRDCLPRERVPGLPRAPAGPPGFGTASLEKGLCGKCFSGDSVPCRTSI